MSGKDNTLRSVLTPNHIYVVLKQYSCLVKEDSEILISLFNHQSNKFIRLGYLCVCVSSNSRRSGFDLLYSNSEYYHSEMGKHGLGFHGSDMVPVKIAPMLFMVS